MPIVVLLAELGLIPEAVVSVVGAIAGCYAILHAWRAIRAALQVRRS